jgi:hypothetical protein
MAHSEPKPTISAADVEAQGIAYMEQRYGVPFTMDKVWWSGVLGNVVAGVYVTSPTHPYCNSTLVRWSSVDGVDVFQDDYLYCPMADEYAARFQDWVDAGFPINHLSVRATGPDYPVSFNSSTTFEEFQAFVQPVASIITVVAVPDTAPGIDAAATRLGTQLRTMSGKGLFQVVVLTPANFELWKQSYPVKDGVSPNIAEERRIRDSWN